MKYIFMTSNLIKYLLVIGMMTIAVAKATNLRSQPKQNACAEVTLAIKSQGAEEQVRGVVVDKDGYIMTTARPVRTADQIIVYFNDGSVQFAEVYSANNIADVAMLKVEALPRSTCVIRLKKMEYLKPGTLIAGSTGEEVQISEVIDLYQEKSTIGDQSRRAYYVIKEGETFAPGTPMYDLSGKFAGFISDTLRAKTKVCVTAQIAKRKLMDVVSFWTGADVQLINVSELNVGQEMGFNVRKLSEKSALAREGLRPGDVIIDIEGMTATNIDELEELYQQFKASEGIITVHYVRDGRTREAEVDMN